MSPYRTSSCSPVPISTVLTRAIIFLAIAGSFSLFRLPAVQHSKRGGRQSLDIKNKGRRVTNDLGIIRRTHTTNQAHTNNPTQRKSTKVHQRFLGRRPFTILLPALLVFGWACWAPRLNAPPAFAGGRTTGAAPATGGNPPAAPTPTKPPVAVPAAGAVVPNCVDGGWTLKPVAEGAAAAPKENPPAVACGAAEASAPAAPNRPVAPG